MTVASTLPILDGPERPAGASSGGGAQLHVRVVLERLPDRALDQAQVALLRLGRLGERPGDRRDHEAVRVLGEREGARLAGGADDPARRPREAGQVVGLAAAGAGGQLGGEAGRQRQLQPEGEGRLDRGGALPGGVVEQREVAAEEVVGGAGWRSAESSSLSTESQARAPALRAAAEERSRG